MMMIRGMTWKVYTINIVIMWREGLMMMTREEYDNEVILLWVKKMIC